MQIHSWWYFGGKYIHLFCAVTPMYIAHRQINDFTVCKKSIIEVRYTMKYYIRHITQMPINDIISMDMSKIKIHTLF